MYFVEKAKDSNIFKRFDYPLFFAILALTTIGILVVRSATLTRADGGYRIVTTQIIGIIIGVILCFIICSIDYKDFKSLGIIFYIGSIFLLLLVLVIGSGDQLGSRSWMNIASYSFQPSEIAKIAFIIVLSMFFERIYEDQRDKKQNIIKLAIYAAIPIALIIAQHDFGTCLVFIFIFFVMAFMCGLRYKYILIGTGIFTLMSPLIWFFVLNNNRRNRILVFLNPELDPLGAGFNVLRSKMAIGSGQIFGKGLFHGIQTQNSIVPVKESDFIFSVVGEELGFIGTILVLALMLFILFRCIYIAKNSRDTYGSFLVIGVASMFAGHFIENIGMTIGIFPVTGIPLPFVSAGGSALVTSFISFGIVMGVSMRRKKVIFNN